MGVNDALEAIKKEGWEATPNEDVGGFPNLKGEYQCTWAELAPFKPKDEDNVTAYLAKFEIEEAYSGDKGVGRNLSRFYNIAGSDYEGKPLTAEAIGDNVKRLIKDAKTVGVDLVTTGTDLEFVASFGSVIGKVAYVRAWEGKSSSGKKFQSFVVKRKEDVGKEGKSAAKSDLPF